MNSSAENVDIILSHSFVLEEKKTSAVPCAEVRMSKSFIPHLESAEGEAALKPPLPAAHPARPNPAAPVVKRHSRDSAPPLNGRPNLLSRSVVRLCFRRLIFC